MIPMRLFGTLLALGALLPSLTLAQTWPTKPIRVIVPFSAGGAQDTLARAINGELGQILGQNILVENRVGAGGTIGTAAVAKAAPDGYTMILAAASHTINGSLYRKLDYDPLKDFTPMAALAVTNYVLVGSGAKPFNNLAELIAYGKANPGKLNFSSAGVGSAGHLSAAYFLALAGVEAVHVPTKGMADAMTEVVAGRCDITVLTNNVAIPFSNDKRTRFLGVTSPAASPFIPDVAPISATLHGYEFESWFGFLGPAGVPPAVTERLNSAVTQLVKMPEIAERLRKQGVNVLTMAPDQFAAYLRADFDRMAKVVKAAGAKVE
ncbi:MAG: tripartite tricarboxylate transporter substrate binding protein [Burkholderiales bacterium]